MPQAPAGLRISRKVKRGNDEGRERDGPEADKCVSGRGFAFWCLHLKKTMTYYRLRKHYCLC